jgi:hypothetical protein
MSGKIKKMVFELKGNDFGAGWKCKFDQILRTMLSSTKIEDFLPELGIEPTISQSKVGRSTD